MCCLRRPSSRRKQGTTTFETRTISSTGASSAGIPFRPAKSSEIRRALVRSPHESGCTASLRISSCSGARKRAKPTCRRFSTKTGERSSRCSHCAKTRAASSGPMRGIFCLSRLRSPVSVSGILIPLSRRPGWFRVVRPRELPELWTAHYKGQQICEFRGPCADADNTTVRRAEQLAEPRPATRKDWQDERNRCSQLPDRILSHLSSSSRARISESWAASTGSRHKAERSAVLSQKEAAGSTRTSSMLGRSPAVGPLLIQDSSRRSARNYIDAGAPLHPRIKRVVILRVVRDSQPRSEQMTVTASEAAHSGCDSGGSILEVVWQHYTFPRPGVENRTDRTAERDIVSPELHLQASSSAIEKDRTLEPRPWSACRACQGMPGDEQIVRPRYPKHLYSDQHGCYHNGMHAVHSNAVHALKPSQKLAAFTQEARIRSQICHRSARFHSANHILLGQILVLH